MERGICKLCLQERMLCKSHLAPTGLYKYRTARDLGPMRFTSKEISAGNPEVTAYLLCQSCENHLNRGRELATAEARNDRKEVSVLRYCSKRYARCDRRRGSRLRLHQKSRDWVPKIDELRYRTFLEGLSPFLDARQI